MLAGKLQSRLLRQSADLRLALNRAEGKQRMRKLPLRQAAEHIGLILRTVTGGTQEIAPAFLLDTGIMPRSDAVIAEG